MSLRVWLPLTGHLNNQGVSNSTTPLSSASAQYVTGKLGQCLHIANYATNTVTFPELNGATVWSVAVWLKINSTDAYSSYADFFDIGMKSGTATGWFRFEHNNVAGGHQIVFPKAANYINSNGWYTVYSSTVTAKDKWAHFVVTNDGVNCKTYVDGVLSSTHPIINISPTTCELDGRVLLGMAGAYCYLNDLRIYDHVLSNSEITELSQGLMVHYPLDGLFGTNLNIFSRTLFDTSYSGWGSVNSSSLRLVTVDDRACLTATKGTTDNLFVYTLAGYTAGSTVTYTVSFDIYATAVSTWSFNVMLSTTQASGWQSLSVSGPYSTQNLIAGWNHVSRTVTCYHASYSGSLMMFLGTPGAPFSMYHPKLENGAVETPYIPNVSEIGISATSISDASGYGNIGTLNGAVSYITDAPRYLTGLSFNGVDNYIRSTNAVLANSSTEYTVSCWFYPNTSHQGAIFTNRTAADSNGIAIFYVAGNMYIDFGGRWTLTPSRPITVGQWNHICVTVIVGGVSTCYVNGGVAGTTTQFTSAPAYGNATWFSVGGSQNGTTTVSSANHINGRLSDFRVYATALSASEVEKLYNTSMKVDNEQSIHVYELNEESGTTKIGENGILETDEFYESDSILINGSYALSYTPAANITNSCSSNIAVDFADYSELGKDLKIHMSLDMEYTQFTAGTGGSFALYFQGNNYNKVNAVWEWTGTNYVTTALNNQLRPDSKVTAGDGVYHYDTQITIPASWFNTYRASHLQFRCNFSDGTGTVGIKNVKVTPAQYYDAKISNDFVSAREFIEI